MPLSTGQVLNQRYRIVRLLGQGGFGAVYRAWDLNLKHACALKENLDTSPESVAQFQREALMLADLDHPNLARVTDHFLIKEQGQYLVMDYVEGEDLQQMLGRSDDPINESLVVKWVSEVCDALDYLHKHDPPIIHRDIKPANIKITPGGKAMLVDFGIAKIYDPNLVTTVGARAITPGYSPPEQYGQGKTDLQSDIYSLGATAYTLLTLQVPPDSVDVLSGNQAPPVNVRKLNPRVSKYASEAVHKAMNPSRENRFKSAKLFKDALLAEYMPEQVIPIEPEGIVSPVHIAESSQARVKDQTSAELPDIPEPGAEIPKESEYISSDARETRQDTSSRKPPRRLVIFGVVMLGLILIGGAAIVIWMVSNDRSDPLVSDQAEVSEPGELAAITSDDEGEIIIWFSNPEGSPVHDGLSVLVEYANEQFPDMHISIAEIPEEEMATLYPESVNSGGGPDLIMVSSMDARPWIEEGLVFPVSEHLQENLDAFHWKSLEAMTFQDQLYGMPISAWILGIYFNPSMIEEPPWEFESLLEMVSAGDGFSAYLNAISLYGFFNGFGGQLLDEEGRCVIHETGGVETMEYLLELKELGADFDPEFFDAESQFLERENSLMLGGPGKLGQYREMLGDDLGMVPLPAGPRDVSSPLVNFNGLYINPNSHNIDGAIQALQLLTDREASQIYSEVTLSIPVRWDVEPPDPIQKVFVEILDTGDLINLRWEFRHYEDPFNKMFYTVLVEGFPPEEALAVACEEMNSLNEK